jgi:hypothetical protein
MATMTSIQLDYSYLVQDDRVNGRVYYDPEIFRNEMERIWHREWVYVAHESEVPEPGDYVTRQIGLQPVIVSRGCSIAVCIAATRSVRANVVTLMRFDVPTTDGPTTIAAIWSACRTRPGMTPRSRKVSSRWRRCRESPLIAALFSRA